jgi:hypothetical protein
MWVVVAVCAGTLSFDWMPIIATIATTAKQTAATTSSPARSLSRPISPRCLSVCEDKQVLDSNTFYGDQRDPVQMV